MIKNLTNTDLFEDIVNHLPMPKLRPLAAKPPAAVVRMLHASSVQASQEGTSELVDLSWTDWRIWSAGNNRDNDSGDLDEKQHAIFERMPMRSFCKL